MIDRNKQYRTRDGREVRIYAVDGRGMWPIHGAIKVDGGWAACTWFDDGRAAGDRDAALDLIEVKPRIQREVWVNVYPEIRECLHYETKNRADQGAMPHRIACVKLTIDCEEGEGL
jgi:hypothetical protein